MDEETYFSRGKLLLTGEYLVMEGALALALPLKMGQSMTIRSIPATKGKLSWVTYVKNKPWFTATYDHQLQIVESSGKDKAFLIQQIIQQALKLSPSLLQADTSVEITTSLNFLPEWGFGSSSSLISNVAYWAHCDPYELFTKIAVGSGYDVACARAKGPILYSLMPEGPVVSDASFNPSYASHLWFVYLGKKQHSVANLAKYRIKIEEHRRDAFRITQITQDILRATSLSEFEENIIEHEEIISTILGETPVKKRLFPDFAGSMKSLGAWGGDFMLVTHQGTRTDVEKYFKLKGMWPVFSYSEIVL